MCVKEKKRENIMQRKLCVPPCSWPMPDYDTHQFCFVCLGEGHTALSFEHDCEHNEIFSIVLDFCVFKGHNPQ